MLGHFLEHFFLGEVRLTSHEIQYLKKNTKILRLTIYRLVKKHIKFITVTYSLTQEGLVVQRFSLLEINPLARVQILDEEDRLIDF